MPAPLTWKDMIEQAFCCVLELCCGGPKKRHAKQELAEKFQANDPTLTQAQAMEAAVFTLDHFDLAPVGTLRELKKAIRAYVLAYPDSYNED